MSLSCHKTMQFSMPFIFEAVGLENVSLVNPFFYTCNRYCTCLRCYGVAMECNAHHTTYLTQCTWDSTCWVKKLNLDPSFQDWLQACHMYLSKFCGCSPWYTKQIQWTFNLSISKWSIEFKLPVPLKISICVWGIHGKHPQSGW